jgi:hypothetical protein
MLVFLDTEFTDFARHDLISLALVAEDGREFYAERTDYQRAACSAFVLENVVPFLGRVSGAACNRFKLQRRLHTWFNALPEKATVIYDFEGDWQLLTQAIQGLQRSPLPENFGDPLCLSSTTITHPVFDTSKNLIYTQDWPPHHALADARALMAGYRAWRPFMEKIWRIQ